MSASLIDLGIIMTECLYTYDTHAIYNSSEAGAACLCKLTAITEGPVISHSCEGRGHTPAQLAHMYRFDTATPAVNPVLMRRVELPGGWNLDDYNTTQARILAFLPRLNVIGPASSPSAAKC